MEGTVCTLDIEDQYGFLQAENFPLSLSSAPFRPSLSGCLQVCLMDGGRDLLNNFLQRCQCQASPIRRTQSPGCPSPHIRLCSVPPLFQEPGLPPTPWLFSSFTQLQHHPHPHCGPGLWEPVPTQATGDTAEREHGEPRLPLLSKGRRIPGQGRRMEAGIADIYTGVSEFQGFTVSKP